MFKRIRDVIAPVEEIDITKEELASIVTKSFLILEKLSWSLKVIKNKDHQQLQIIYLVI